MQETTDAAAAGCHAVPVQIVLDQQQLNTELAGYLGEDQEFSNIQVSLVPGQILATGTADVAGFSVNVRVHLGVVITNGIPRLQVTGLDILGGLGAFIPGAVKTQIINMINERLDVSLVGDLPVFIDSVGIGSGAVTIAGTLT